MLCVLTSLDQILVDVTNFDRLISSDINSNICIKQQQPSLHTNKTAIKEVIIEPTDEEKRKQNIKKWNDAHENLVLHYKYLAKFGKHTEEYFSIFKWLKYPDMHYSIQVGENFEIHIFTASLLKRGKPDNKYNNLKYSYFYIQDNIGNILFPICIKYIEKPIEYTKKDVDIVNITDIDNVNNTPLESLSIRSDRFDIQQHITKLYKEGNLFSPVKIGQYFEDFVLPTELSVKDYMSKNFKSIKDSKAISDYIDSFENQQQLIDIEMFKDIAEHKKLSNIIRIEIITCKDKDSNITAKKEKIFFNDNNITVVRYTSTQTDHSFNMHQIIPRLKINNNKTNSVIELNYLSGVGKYGSQKVNEKLETIIFSNLFNKKLKSFCELFGLVPDKNKVFKFDRHINYKESILKNINKVFHDFDIINSETHVRYLDSQISFLNVRFNDIYEKIDGLFCSPDVINQQYYVHVCDSHFSYEVNLNECFDVKLFVKSYLDNRKSDDMSEEKHVLFEHGYISVNKKRYCINDNNNFIYTVYNAKNKKKEVTIINEDKIKEEIDNIDNIIKDIWKDNIIAGYSKKEHNIETENGKIEINIELFYDDKEIVIHKIGNNNYMITVKMTEIATGIKYIINSITKTKIKFNYTERSDVSSNKNEKWIYKNYLNNSIEYVNDHKYDSNWAVEYLKSINKLLKLHNQHKLDTNYISVDVQKINIDNLNVPQKTSITYKDNHVIIYDHIDTYFHMIIINDKTYRDIAINNDAKILIKRFGNLIPKSHGNGTSTFKDHGSNININKVESYNINKSTDSNDELEVELQHLIEYNNKNDLELKLKSKKLLSRLCKYGYKVGISKNNKPCIIKIELLEESQVAGQGIEKKLRTNTCKVIGIFEFSIDNASVKYDVSSKITQAVALFDKHFEYILGQVISVDNFNTDLTKVCVPGIHFFLDQEDALNFYCNQYGFNNHIESHIIYGFNDVERFNYSSSSSSSSSASSSAKRNKEKID